MTASVSLPTRGLSNTIEQSSSITCDPESTVPLSDDLQEEVLYGRDHDHLRIFVSSRMNGSLDNERRVAAETISSVSGHKAWWWEVDAPMGALHSEQECVSFARTSDGIVLLIAGALSEIVLAEYHAASDAGAQRYVLVRDTPADTLPRKVKKFVADQQAEVVSRKFRNDDELRTHLYNALRRSLVRAIRLDGFNRRRAGT